MRKNLNTMPAARQIEILQSVVGQAEGMIEDIDAVMSEQHYNRLYLLELLHQAQSQCRMLVAGLGEAANVIGQTSEHHRKKKAGTVTAAPARKTTTPKRRRHYGS